MFDGERTRIIPKLCSDSLHIYCIVCGNWTGTLTLSRDYQPRQDCVEWAIPRLYFYSYNDVHVNDTWATTWQNQQSDCAPSEDSEQPGHPPSLIRVFAVRMKKAWVLSYPLSAQWRLIRLGGCPGWSESSLGAHSFCWFCYVAAQILCMLCFTQYEPCHEKTCPEFLTR